MLAHGHQHAQEVGADILDGSGVLHGHETVRKPLVVYAQLALEAVLVGDDSADTDSPRAVLLRGLVQDGIRETC